MRLSNPRRRVRLGGLARVLATRIPPRTSVLQRAIPLATATPGYIGPYRLLNVVHTSKAGQIWQAYHDGKQEMVGIKTLQEKSRRDREEIGYLKWEYSVGRGLQHKCVIRMHEFGIDRGSPFLALEWFSAPNMKQRIRDGVDKIGHLVPKIIECAALGLGYLNSQGWVHRDVKPDNFLVADDGQVKLIDFGLAVRSKGKLGKLLSRKTKVQGTRSYMAPEQIRGQALDIRADVYSFACTIYHLLAGTPPFTGNSTNELLNKHLKAAPPSLSGVIENITPGFSYILRRAMAKNPADRHASVNDMLTEIRMNKVYLRAPRPPQDPPANPTSGGKRG